MTLPRNYVTNPNIFHLKFTVYSEQRHVLSITLINRFGSLAIKLQTVSESHFSIKH